ncbi:hypothetical protein AB0J86_13390 [Micromonospora sp. NPDC049559]|uniref:hypothetical protein n=1 Tax=Micromonospora sp. NPDC049559 TaxID=3155923 RepID=UPI003438FF2F
MTTASSRLPAVILALTVLGGCSSSPQAAPSGAPTPTDKDGRAACSRLFEVGRALNTDPATNLEVGQLAQKSTNPDIVAKGQKLADASAAAASNSGSPGTDLMIAQVALAQVCEQTFRKSPR